MIDDEIRRLAVEHMGVTPTQGQYNAIKVFGEFLTDRRSDCAMVLTGSAGTGKTTLASAFVRMLRQLEWRIVLLAPTGRAAKVFGVNASHPAYTIHRRIYRQKTAADLSAFSLNFNTATDTLFLVDEASMVSNQGFKDTAFGSGNLLDDLIQFVYSGTNCRLMLIGDKAQLPPIGESESPALNADVLRCYGLNIHEADIDEVLRQSADSGILYNATLIRHAITSDSTTQMPRIRLRNFADLSIVTGDLLVETMTQSYREVGIDETIVVTRSNKRANIYNRGIRNTILNREDMLNSGDLLAVVKNNYHYTSSQLPFIANGDRCIVNRVRNIREFYGFRFADAILTFPDYNDYELTATVMLDTLASEAPALTREQQEQFYNNVMEDYADITTKGKRMKALKEDVYYNALQIKYGYAVTCHKAQGGQWAHVYLDQGYMPQETCNADYVHWLYTAFTRATERLFLVNWPKQQVEEEQASPQNP